MSIPYANIPKYYTRVQDRLIALVTDGGTDLATTIPATPDWTIRDLLAHLAGVPADVIAGNMADAPSEAWTHAHVSSRVEATPEEIIAEWREQIALLQDALATPNATGLFSDVVVHEQDVRGALGQPGARDTDEIRAVAEVFIASLGRRFAEKGLPALKVVVDGEAHVIGEGEPAGELTLSAFEATRVFTGRRSPDQVKARFTSGNPQVWIDSLFLFGPRKTPLSE